MRGMVQTLIFAILMTTWLVDYTYAGQNGSSVIKGSVENAQTGEPLVGAHIILGGTKQGSVTNQDGEFELTDIPEGAYQIRISKIGYRNVSHDQMISDETHTLNFELYPDATELGEVKVEAERDDSWKNHFETFKAEFIGTSERADYVEIVNPEVLEFRTNFRGRLQASAIEPLEIKNHHLGYRITFFLDHFEAEGMTTMLDGEPLFEEMIPEDSDQAEEWEENRKDAFKGSFRHFMIALIEDRLGSEGFALREEEEQIQDGYGRTDTRVSSSQLMNYDEDEEAYKLNFEGILEVRYTNAAESRRFVDWIDEPGYRRSRTQTSYISLNQRPLTVDADGGILETFGATRLGYFGFHRLADLTPKEYQP